MTETNHKNELERTDAAWAKLQQKLKLEPEQPQWAQWSETYSADAALTGSNRVREAEESTASAGSMLSSDAPAAADEADPAARYGTAADSRADRSANRSGAFGSWLRKRKRWIAAVAAVAVVAVTVATPTGNQALAAILNSFRMQQLTVVQQNDLQTLLNSAFGDGKEREAINKFGTFTNVSGKSMPEVEASEAAKVVGHKVIFPKEYNMKKVYISPSNSITFRMNVDEVNKTMKRLGAKKLLPESVDGKPITLEMGPMVHLYVLQGSDEKRDVPIPGYSFSQTPVPTVTVDPSIPVSEALDAVLQFPLLPEGLKENLKTASVLQGGSIPLPIIENGQVEKVKLAGVDVIITTNTYDRGVEGQRAYYSATWVKDGQLYRLDGSNALTDRQAVVNKATELIQS
ncbi:hypothetical protein [Paenibacillus thalictri]|uniref:DUF4367 domain-containing protein n=1 Tax=Paenibacillus thalictri TaxID=2527873 RepID=A0A4Q9DXS4_9BACL|nr:hypothetical protein [Paenibacillus thalictri]TBL80663.1 hypothetical protein EYB31_05390 [Paenibacillus thalictri]